MHALRETSGTIFLRSPTPDGKQGLAWKTKVGTVGLDAVKKNYLIVGKNEKGLCDNLFFHEGCAECAKQVPTRADKAFDVPAVCPYLLTACATTEEARKTLGETSLVGDFVKEIGSVAPVHMIILSHAPAA
ncbi:MAG: linear amide C-N hydrolase [Pirellulaceae bacterium]|jgi:penicillin V acylase-like amidase (Ntn superfamily)|nr:linear amide C-N hydrolase [Pirellulaceae bacterium]